MSQLPDVHALDAGYQPFPPFERWVETVEVDESRWDRYLATLKSRAEIDAAGLERARNVAKRAAAVDTGAIEGLYETDRGFTFTVALESATWEAALLEKGEAVRAHFDDQLHGYEFVLDLATGKEPFSEAALRQLHSEACRSQATYSVVTSVGPQQQTLPKGQYKSAPNHVLTREGRSHSYAPVDMTPPEMARLFEELRSDQFNAAHPVLQATYAHYGLVVVHPFADGNGRVARALASMYTYRSISMPIMILVEHKASYFDALEAADAGESQMLVNFMLDRVLDTIQLVEDSVRTAQSPSREESLSAIARLYVTRGGFTHEEVDQAGLRLVDVFTKALSDVIPQRILLPVTGGVSTSSQRYAPEDAAFRLLVDGTGRFISARLGTPRPAEANVSRNFQLEIPRDAAGDDDLVIRAQGGNDAFVVRVDDVVPAASGVLVIRARMFAERVVDELLSELSAKAARALKR